MWARLWVRPQAVIWEADGQEEEVAVYVRTFCQAAERNGTVAGRTLVLRQQENLGLSQPGLMRLRWRIAADAAPAAREARTRDARRASDKARFQVIEGEAAKAG